MHQLKYVHCNLCGANDFEVLYRSTLSSESAKVSDYVGTNPGYGKFHDMVKCRHCGLVYMNPRDANIPELLGQVVDLDYLSTWAERMLTFKSHLESLESIRPKGRLLDVGCYAGAFLSAAKSQGYEVEGVEPSEWAASYAQKTVAVPVTCTTMEDMKLPDERYDIVTMWDVIEHLEDPSKSLARIFKSLTPGGILAITTHDIESLFAKVAGKRYPWLMRFHLNHFSPKTMRAMLEAAGFEIVSTDFYGKVLPISYVLARVGIQLNWKWLSRVLIPLNMGDMFLMIAKKNQANG